MKRKTLREFVKLYESPAERRARRRAESKKRSDDFNARFAERLTKATAALEETRGRKLTPPELAAMLRERTGKPVTARLVARWYRALSPPPREIEYLIQLAEILNVTTGWLAWGEGSGSRAERGVYTDDYEQFSLVNNNGCTIAAFHLLPPIGLPTDKKAIVGKCYELLDIVSPAQPSLRVVK